MLNLKQAAAEAPTTFSGPLPVDTLTRVKVEVSDLKKSQAGNDMLNIALHAEGQYHGARILTQIMLTAEGGTKASPIGAKQILSILSAAGVDISQDANTNFADFRAVAQAIHGKVGAVKTKINDRGYTDVKVFIAPDQSLGTVNAWNDLLKSEQPASAPAGGPGLGLGLGATQNPPAQSPSFGASQDIDDEIPF